MTANAKPSLPPPVIVLASPESGGSLLSALLGRHPAFCAAPYLNALAFEAPWQLLEYARVPRDPHLHGLLRFVAQGVTGEQSIQSVQTAMRWLKRRGDLPAADLYRALQALVAPRRLVDFSPLHARSATVVARVMAAAPEAVFIHLVRDPLSQGQALSYPVWQTITTSLEEWSKRGRYQPCLDIFEVGEHYIDWSVTPAVFDPQFAWYRTQMAILRATGALPQARCLRLRLDELLASPQDVLAKLLDWLGVAAAPGQIEHMHAGGVPRYAHPGPYTAPFGMDFELMGRSLGSVLAGGAPTSPWLDRHKPLPWRGDGEPLLADVVELARALGFPLWPGNVIA